MARLIPSFTDDKTPPGERAVFNMIAAGPTDWTAFHSLDLSPWNRGLRTEIDFVVVVPDTGLLCVEVKSHDTIFFDGERWHPATISRSPFKQAADGSRTFFRRLCDLAPRFRRVPVVYCCIFPNAQFEVGPNLSVQPWEVMDVRAFRSFRTGNDFCSALRDRMRQSIEADGNILPLSNPLVRNDVEALINFCVPIAKHHPSGRAEIERRQVQIESVLRQQQKPVLNLASANDRIVVSGGAGTGKTLIAMEVARRAAERGERVALLCFNQLLGDWLTLQMSKILPPLPNIVVGRAIKILANMAGLEIPPNPTNDFWRNDLPDLLLERLTDPEFRTLASFDYLVLDEAQDVLARPRLWECLTETLAGGIGTGKYALFGDFENQVLTERPAMELALHELLQASGVARWKLGENCRNYPLVGETAVRLSGIENPVYSGYMRSGGGAADYDIVFYETGRAQLDQLGNWLREFKQEGYRASDITVLSFCTPDVSAAARLAPEGFALRPVWQGGNNTGYTSVQAFKGMENKVIILTDVVLEDPQFQRDLFYVGMTRATDSVRVLCAISSQDVLSGWITRTPR